MGTPSDPERQRDSSPSPWVGALLLLAVVGVLTSVLSYTAYATRDRIERNRQAWLIAGLDKLLAGTTHDNDPITDVIEVRSPELLGTARPVKVYRARREGQPVAAVLRPIAPDGYRGAIELLVAIRADGTLLGVEVLRHNETPGLGDAFEHRERGWLDRFAGMSLERPPQHRWTVRSDGGDFDAFTGATITPRAIVKAVRRTLELYKANREQVFEQP